MSQAAVGRPGLLIVVHEDKKLGAVHAVAGDSADPVRVKLAPLGSAAGRVLRAAKSRGPVSR